MGPVAPAERIVTLDVLRGVAVLGILLVNIELFRGADLYRLMAGEALDLTGADEAVQFLVGWLASGKFISSFALLFGLGAAIMTERSLRAGRAPRGVLARRYAWLAVLGVAHMLLLFPGDILFVYAVSGFLLLPFLFVRVRAIVGWAGGLVAVYLLLTLGLTALGAAVEPPDLDEPPPGAVAVEEVFAERGEAAIAAYTDGGLGDQLRVRALEAAVLQGGQLFLVPWVLALFLFGFAFGKAGLPARLATDAAPLRRTAAIALPAGLLLNLPLGFAGTLGGAAVGPDAELSTALLLTTAVAQLVAAPLLAVGYLSGIALLCRRPGFLRTAMPLRRTGRMALTAYLLQSVLCWGFFVGLGFYDALAPAQALLVVAAVWVAILAAGTLWMARFDMGPVERLWRRLTYGPPARPPVTPPGPTPTS